MPAAAVSGHFVIASGRLTGPNPSTGTAKRASHRGPHILPASLLDLRGRRRRRARVSSIKWDEQGAGSFWGALGRSRHGGDPRPHAQERSDRDLIVPDLRRSILGASRSRGGRSTACSRARARCRGGCGARRGRARAGAALITRRVAPGDGRGEEAPQSTAISLCNRTDPRLQKEFYEKDWARDWRALALTISHAARRRAQTSSSSRRSRAAAARAALARPPARASAASRRAASASGRGSTAG